MAANETEIALDKKQRREKEKLLKLKEKQLERQRIRIYNEMVAREKINKKKIKHAPKDVYISLQHINKIYDNKVQAVFDFNLDIKQHEFVVFVGPSGCGKSTTLRMIAGLEDITAGDLYIDKTYANDLHPKDRDIAMVFQSYALYPHMNVASNMAFGLKIKRFPTLKVDENGNPILGINKKAIKVLKNQLKELQKYASEEENTIDVSDDIAELEEKIKYLETTPVEIYQNKHMPKDEIRQRVMKAAQILQIEEYLQRKPKALSGGQCQRVALGRAIVKNAKVFLMDEPLSNLDAKLRVAMRSEIIKLHNSLNATTIYVTHDQTEAMTMATRIVVMNKGYIQQIGTPIEIYNHPANIFVATFIGSPAMNLFKIKYSNKSITFSHGLSIELPKEFDKAIKNFYPQEIKNIQLEFDNLEKDFVERNNILSQIEKNEQLLQTADEKQKVKISSVLEKLRDELKICEESNSRRVYLLNALNSLNKVQTNGIVDLIFGIRPEDVYQANRVLTDESISSPIDLKVSVAELLGHEYYVHSDFAEGEIVSKIHAKTIVNTGDDIKVVFDISKIHLFDPITEKIII